MKKLLVLLTLLTSVSTFATEFTIEERAQLHTVKMMLEIQLEQVEEAVANTKENVETYANLSRFSLKQKRHLRAKNCGEIKATIGANMLMVATSLEQAKAALSKVEVSDENGLSFQENFLKYIEKAREASKNCQKISKSAEILESGYSNLKISSKILIDALPSLLDE